MKLNLSEDGARMLVNRRLQACRKGLRGSGAHVGVGAIGVLLHQRTSARLAAETVPVIGAGSVIQLSTLNLAHRALVVKWALGFAVVVTFAVPTFGSFGRQIEEHAVRSYLDEAARKSSRYGTFQAEWVMQFSIGSERTS